MSDNIKSIKKNCDICGSEEEVDHIELFFGTTSYFQANMCSKHSIDFICDYHVNFNRFLEEQQKKQPRYSKKHKPRVKLIGENKSAYSIFVRVSSALRKSGLGDQMKKFQKEAMLGDYNNLLQTAIKYVDVY